MLRQEEQKLESSFTSSSEWQMRFEHVAILTNGEYLVGVSNNARGSLLQICNIKTQQCICNKEFGFTIQAITVTKDNDLILVANLSNIHHLTIDMEKTDIPHKRNGIIKIGREIFSMALLQDGQIALGHRDGLVSIWNLNTRQETKKFIIGKIKITAIDTQPMGSLVLANGLGTIFIQDQVSNNYIEYSIGKVIKSLIVLPDMTIVFGDLKGFLYHMDYDTHKLTSIQIDARWFDLVRMPNGYIGCCANRFQLIEPSWIRNHIAYESETKNVVNKYLPPVLTELVTEYAANIMLFSSPKMPHNMECILETIQDHSVGFKNR